jgi:opacity protein-like surface antigen
MNKKKLTLLIALSISIIIMASSWVISAICKPEEIVETQEVIVVEDPEPLPPSAVEVIEVEEETKEIVLLSIDEIAKEVIEGKWGNGDERKAALIEAGYDYEAVQAKIVELTPPPVVTKPAAAPSKLPTGNYPEAQLIWDTMISWGWTPETCAGIIGNMMAEIGGGTLNLSNWNSNGGCGYGLIQWTSGRRSLIKSRYGSYPNIEQQLIFMRDELFGTNNTPQQVSSSVLNRIMNTNGNETLESIAFCFASHYERCAKQYRAKRQGYARIAYDYFMNK